MNKVDYNIKLSNPQSLFMTLWHCLDNDWQCHDTIMTLSWRCHYSVMTLHWHYHGTVVTLSLQCH